MTRFCYMQQLKSHLRKFLSPFSFPPLWPPPIFMLCCEIHYIVLILQMGPSLEKTVASFRLLPPTESYVPPYKDPWRFWWLHFKVWFRINILSPDSKESEIQVWLANEQQHCNSFLFDKEKLVSSWVRTCNQTCAKQYWHDLCVKCQCSCYTFVRQHCNFWSSDYYKFF